MDYWKDFTRNYKWALEKAEFQDIERKKVALSLTVFTAHYLFYLPKEWCKWYTIFHRKWQLIFHSFQSNITL